MSTDEQDDHLPPPVRTTPANSAKAAVSVSPWPDRATFLLVGILAGFASAYLYLERTASFGPPAAVAQDPQAGLSGVGPGASRDLPGSGGGQPSLGPDPTATRKLAALEVAAAREPKNAEILVQLGNAAYDAEDWKKAITAYEAALKIKDGDPGVLTDLGVAYRNVGNADRALAMFGQALARDPSHWPAQFNQAIIFGIDKGDAPKALEILARLRKDHPEVPALDRLEAEIRLRAKGRPGA